MPDRIVSVIRRHYEGFACQVIHSGRISEDFKISTGIRHGYMLSPLLFLAVLDRVTRTAYASSGKGIQFLRTLEDLEFADDLALLSHRLQDVQEKVNALISQDKTKLLRTNNQQEGPVTIEGAAVEHVNEFVYLGSKMIKTGGTDEDMKTRIKKAQQAFATLRPVWKSTAISVKTKLRVFNSNVKAVLLNGSATWKVTANISKKIQTFVNKCLRQILHLKLFDRVPNTVLWTRAKQEPMVIQIRRRKWRWVGHNLREEPSNITRQALEWNPQGKRKRGRPKQTWRRSLHSELGASNLAKDRRRWKMTVEDLCSTRSKEKKKTKKSTNKENSSSSLRSVGCPKIEIFVEMFRAEPNMETPSWWTSSTPRISRPEKKCKHLELKDIYASVFPNILTPKIAKNHEKSVYFLTNAIFALGHAPP